MDEDQIAVVKAYVNNSNDELSDQYNLGFLINGTNTFTFSLNALLRGNIEVKGLNKYCEILNSIFKSGFGHLKVYRACNYLELCKNRRNQFVIDKGYMSTSKRKNIACKFLEEPKACYLPAFLEINLNNNSPIISIESILGKGNENYEEEVLIKRCAKFRILQEIETFDLSEYCERRLRNINEVRFLQLEYIQNII